MIRVLFFARIREQLGESRLELEASPALASVGALRDTLKARSPHWAQVLGADNVIMARNQEVVQAGAPLRDGDEVAFYPPVTGG